jgi:hypothetical protein
MLTVVFALIGALGGGFVSVVVAFAVTKDIDGWEGLGSFLAGVLLGVVVAVVTATLAVFLGLRGLHISHPGKTAVLVLPLVVVASVVVGMLNRAWVDGGWLFVLIYPGGPNGSSLARHPG